MSEGWSTAEAAKRSRDKCAGCEGKRLYGNVCCDKCWRRIPTEMIKALQRTTHRAAEVRKIRGWLRDNKVGAQ